MLTVGQYTLFHWETLLVVSSGNANNVALPFIAQRVRLHLGAHTLLVEHPELVLVRYLQ